MLCYSDPERSNATQHNKRSANREILRKHRKSTGIQSRNCSVILSSPKHLCFTSWIFFLFQFLLCFIQPLCFCVLLQHFAIHWCFLGCSASDLSEPPYQLAQINRNVA